MKSVLLFLLVVLLAGCIYVPENSHKYDEKCNVMRKQKVLSMEQLGPLGSCSGDACALILAGTGVVSAASFVISGSIVVVSNTVYWLEKPSECASSNTDPMIASD